MSELTEQQTKFIDLIFEPEYCNDYEKAKLEAGYSPTFRVSRILDSEAVVKEIAKRADRYLALNAPKSLARVLDVLNNPEMKGAKTLLEAAWGILDRAGVTKKERLEVEHKAASGVFLIPAKRED